MIGDFQSFLDMFSPSCLWTFGEIASLVLQFVSKLGSNILSRSPCWRKNPGQLVFNRTSPTGRVADNMSKFPYFRLFLSILFLGSWFWPIWTWCYLRCTAEAVLRSHFWVRAHFWSYAPSFFLIFWLFATSTSVVVLSFIFLDFHHPWDTRPFRVLVQTKCPESHWTSNALTALVCCKCWKHLKLIFDNTFWQTWHQFR